MESLSQSAKKTETIKNLITYIIAAVVPLLAVYAAFDLWSYDLHVPIQQGGDTMWPSATIKNLIDGGDIYNYTGLGAPFDIERVVYPVSGYLVIGIWKFMSFFSGSYGLILNVYAIGTFPLTSVIALFALRRLKLKRVVACMGAILYSVITYHFYRFEQHIYVASYFILPLVCVSAIWLMRGDLLKPDAVTAGRRGLGRLFAKFDKPKLLFCVIACVLIGLCEAYYAYFALIVLLFAGIYGAFANKNYRIFILTILLMAVVVLMMALWILKWYLGGDNVSSFMSSTRDIGGVETFFLKLAHMVFPPVTSRVPAFWEFTNSYIGATPNNNENMFASLGLIGTIGFVYSILVVLIRKFSKKDKEISLYGKMNLFLVLVGMSGGLSAVVTFIVPALAMIRCYNRLSIIIAFFSLLAVCTLLERLQDRMHKKSAKSLFFAGVAVLTLFGVYEQTPAFASESAGYMEEKAYFTQVEQTLDEGDAVLQLPVVSAGNHTGYNEIKLYESLKPYLYTNGLKFSFGVDEGTYEEKWLYELMNMPPEKMLEKAVFAGLDGVLVDRYGYTDGGALIENSLNGMLGEPLISGDGRYAFYGLAGYADSLRAQYTEEQLLLLEEQALRLPAVTGEYGEGIYPMELDENGEEFRWATGEAEILLANSTQETQLVRLEFSVRTFSDEPYEVDMDFGDTTFSFDVDSNGYVCAVDLAVPADGLVVRLHTEMPGQQAEGDPRDMRYMISGLKVYEMG